MITIVVLLCVCVYLFGVAVAWQVFHWMNNPIDNTQRATAAGFCFVTLPYYGLYKLAKQALERMKIDHSD